MLIDFVHFYLMVLFAKPTDVVLLTCMRVRGWGCPSSSSVVRIGKAYLAFGKVAPIPDSATEDTTILIRWHRVWIAPLLVGRVVGLFPFLTILLEMEKWPLTRLHARDSQR